MEDILFRFDYFLLFFFRTAAFMATVPIFGLSFRSSAIKIAFALLLSFLLFPVLAQEDWNRPKDFFPFVVMVAKESLIGFCMSFALVLAINSVRIAGDLIGVEMGLSMASQVDPITGSNTPLIAYMYEIMAVLIFLSLNLHHWLFEGLAHSYQILPVGTFDFKNFDLEWFLNSFQKMLVSGIILAAPVFCVMSTVSLALALLARAVPNFNVLDVGYTLRVATAMGAMLLFMPGFISGVGKMFGGLRESMFGMLQSLAN